MDLNATDDQSKYISSIGSDSLFHSSSETREPSFVGAEEELGQGSVKGAIVNLVNSTVGTSVIALATLLQRLGLVLGVIGVLMSGVFGIFTGGLILRCKNLTKQETYVGMGKKSFPKGGEMFISIAQIINNLGQCINYVIICGITTNTLVQAYVSDCTNSESFFCSRPGFSLGVGLVLLPFSFVKSINGLEKASMVKVVAVTIFTLITIGYFLNAWMNNQLSQNINILPDIQDPVTAFATISIATLSCSFQFNMMPIYRGIRRRNNKKMMTAMIVSTTISLFVFVSISIAGYLSFGPAADSLLQNFTLDNVNPVFFILLNVCFFLNCFLTFPIVFFEVKNVTNDLFFKQISEEQANSNKVKITKGFITLVMHSIPVLIGVLATNINQIFQILGSTTMNMFTYIFPTLMYIKLSKGRGSKMFSAIFFLIFGFILLGIGLYSSFVPAPSSNPTSIWDPIYDNMQPTQSLSLRVFK